MEGTIQQAEANVGRIEDLFALPDFHKTYGSRANDLLTELQQAKARIVALYARWEELESIQS